MIPSIVLHNPIKISIPFQDLFFSLKIQSFSLLLILLIAAQSFLSSSTSVSHTNNNNKMRKIHPLPRTRNLTIHDPTRNQLPIATANGILFHKKLRRLPHIFNRVLELPFRSNADVAVEESFDRFRFVAETEGIREARAHTMRIHPGVIKVSVKVNGSLGFSGLDDLEMDLWRFRLPDSTRPELTSVVYEDGELIVTVPKGSKSEPESEEVYDEGGFRDGNRFVIVQ